MVHTSHVQAAHDTPLLQVGLGIPYSGAGSEAGIRYFLEYFVADIPYWSVFDVEVAAVHTFPGLRIPPEPRKPDSSADAESVGSFAQYTRSEEVETQPGS